VAIPGRKLLRRPFRRVTARFLELAFTLTYLEIWRGSLDRDPRIPSPVKRWLTGAVGKTCADDAPHRKVLASRRATGRWSRRFNAGMQGRQRDPVLRTDKAFSVADACR
jgi:hypothetical protein